MTSRGELDRNRHIADIRAGDMDFEKPFIPGTRMNKVSVVIPAYNAERTLRETVESVLAQTYGDLEVIVVDDGSTDGTKDVISDYVEQGRVSYIRRENGGIAASRNTGLAACTGEYIGLLDHDDLWDENKIERQLEFLTENEADFVFCYTRQLRLDGKLHEMPVEMLQYRNIPGELMRHNIIYTSSILFKRSILDYVGLLDESFRYCEDWDWWLRIASSRAKLVSMPERLVTRRDQPRSFSLIYTGKYMYYEKLYIKHVGLMERDRRKAFKKNMANKCYTDAEKLIKAGHREQAFAAFRKAVSMRGMLLFRLPKLVRLYGGAANHSK